MNWVVIWTSLNAMATAALVVVGYIQLRAIRAEAKRERTLAECQKYSTDPIIFGAISSLRRAKLNGVFDKNTAYYRPDIVAVVNYFDGIAIGIDQGLYIEEIAKDHLKPILAVHYNEYVNDKLLTSIGLSIADVAHLVQMWARWNEVKPAYSAK